MYHVVILTALSLLYYLIVFNGIGVVHCGIKEKFVMSNTSNTQEPWLVIPDIRGLCPLSQVCPEYVPNVKQFAEDLFPCCTECSCDVEFCTLRDNCCYPELHSLIDYETVDKHQHQTCTYPIATTVMPEDRIYFTAYYMVTKNPIGGCRYDPEYIAKTGIDPGEDCGDLTIAPWGSLLPVYSTTNLTIYKNRHCAECYGITDAVVWNATIVCKGNNDFKTKINVLNLELSFCHPHFLYVSKEDLLENEECFVKLIDECPQNFEVSPALSLPPKAVGDACTSGLYSPFKKLYRNVFCYICNNEVLKMKCVIPDEGVRHDDVVGYNGPRLLGWLDYDYLQMVHNSFKTIDEIGHRACVVNGDTTDESQCRPLFCPAGQLRYPDGICRYINPIWGDEDYEIFIKLTSSENITNDQLGQAEGFETPWPTSWKSATFWARMEDEPFGQFYLLKYFVASVSHKPTNGINPDIFIQQTIKENLKKTWSLKLPNKTLILTPEIMKYSLPARSVRKVQEGRAVHLNPIFDPLVPDFNPPSLIAMYIDRNRSLTTSGIVITNMFYCRQIQLQSPEFIVLSDNNYLLIKNQSILLYNSEFEVYTDVNGDQVAKICVEYSGLRVEDDINVKPVSSTSVVSVMKVVMTLSVVCICISD